MNKESFCDELRVTTQQGQCRKQKEREERKGNENKEKENQEAEERKRADEIIEKTNQKAIKVALEGDSGVGVYSVSDKEIDKESYNRLGSHWKRYRSENLHGVAKKIAEYYEKEGFETYLYCDYQSYFYAPSHLCPPIILTISWDKEK